MAQAPHSTNTGAPFEKQKKINKNPQRYLSFDSFFAPDGHIKNFPSMNGR